MTLAIPVLSDRAFKRMRDLLYAETGINLSPAKKNLVAGRLLNRMRLLNLVDYGDYIERVLADHEGERQQAINCLTTNETFFFREPRHFAFVREQVLPHWRNGTKRIWSAASSSGEEAYSLAMLLADHCSIPTWEVLGTDISTRVLAIGQAGQYPLQRSKDIPRDMLQRYCLKGVDDQEGTFIVGAPLKAKVSFRHANLKQDCAGLGMFDLVFLRNVMIYFDTATKQQIINSVVQRMNSGGYLIVGHSETLNGICDTLVSVQPSIYRKEWRGARQA